MVVRFHTARHRFADGAWAELETTKIARRDILVPREFPAALPAEQIIDAWGDYKAAIDAFNRQAWNQQSDQREEQRQAQAAHRDALREQRDVIELLDES